VFAQKPSTDLSASIEKKCVPGGGCC
jgi:hypothetical protein